MSLSSGMFILRTYLSKKMPELSVFFLNFYTCHSSSLLFLTVLFFINFFLCFLPCSFLFHLCILRKINYCNIYRRSHDDRVCAALRTCNVVIHH